jgi:hypothetical protein
MAQANPLIFKISTSLQEAFNNALQSHGNGASVLLIPNAMNALPVLSS